MTTTATMTYDDLVQEILTNGNVRARLGERTGALTVAERGGRLTRNYTRRAYRRIWEEAEAKRLDRLAQEDTENLRLVLRIDGCAWRAATIARDETHKFTNLRIKVDNRYQAGLTREETA